MCAKKPIDESSFGSPDQLPESRGSPAENDQDEDELLEAGYGVGTDGDVPDIELIFESTSDAIDRLFRLATKVRNPGIRQIAERVYTYKDVDEETGVNVIDEYAKFDRQHVLQLFDYPRKAFLNEPHDYLVERLTEANVFRRQQFGHWRRRRKKLQLVPANDVSKLALSDNLSRLNLGPGAGETTEPVKALSRIATSKPYTASMLDPSKIIVDHEKSTASVSEYAPTTRGLNNELVDWPSPPSKLKGKKHFECPYCFTICSSKYLERKAWRAHLLRDLRPYICTYEHCADAKNLYDTRNEWAAHENSVHRRTWRCPEHAEITFQNRAAYEDHLKIQHPQEAKLQSFQIMRAGESTTSLPDRPCPFCQTEFPSSSTLQDHIAFHLERIARFALPRSTGVDDEPTSSDNGSADAIGHTDGSQRDDLNMASLGSFSGVSDTYKGRRKRKINRTNVQNRDRDTTAAQTGQRLDQSALKVLEANTSGGEGVNVSEFLQHVDRHRSEPLQLMEQVVQPSDTKIVEEAAAKVRNEMEEAAAATGPPPAEKKAGYTTMVNIKTALDECNDHLNDVLIKNDILIDYYIYPEPIPTAIASYHPRLLQLRARIKSIQKLNFTNLEQLIDDPDCHAASYLISIITELLNSIHGFKSLFENHYDPHLVHRAPYAGINESLEILNTRLQDLIRTRQSNSNRPLAENIATQHLPNPAQFLSLHPYSQSYSATSTHHFCTSAISVLNGRDFGSISSVQEKDLLPTNHATLSHLGGAYLWWECPGGRGNPNHPCSFKLRFHISNPGGSSIHNNSELRSHPLIPLEYRSVFLIKSHLHSTNLSDISTTTTTLSLSPTKITTSSPASSYDENNSTSKYTTKYGCLICFSEGCELVPTITAFATGRKLALHLYEKHKGPNHPVAMLSERFKIAVAGKLPLGVGRWDANFLRF